MNYGHNWKSVELQQQARERLSRCSDKSNDMLNQKAVIYTRVSTDRQAESGDSLEYQIQRCRNYAEMHGIEIIDELVEGSKSAFHNRMEDRPKGSVLHHMLFNSKEINTVIFTDVSRMFRNLGDCVDFTEKLIKDGFNIHEVSGSGELDLTKPNEWLGWMMRAVMACHFSMEKQQRAKEENKRAIKNKKANTSSCYGLDLSDKKNVKVDEEEAEVIRHVFYMYFELGYGHKTVADICSANGARGKKGGTFKKGNSYRIIQKRELYQSYGILKEEKFKPSFDMLITA